MRIRFLNIALLFLVVLVSAAYVPAATCRVTKTADTSDGSCTSGDCSLREAALEPSCMLIDFSLDLAGQTIVLALGDIPITHSVEIRGFGAEALAISGNKTSRIFYVAQGSSAAISGLTLKNGTGIGTGPAGGGAVFAHGGLTIDACYLTGNYSNGPGGAVAFRSFAEANLFNSTVANNASGDGQLEAVIVGDATIFNSTIVNNNGPGFSTDALALIVNSTIRDNGFRGVSIALGGRPTVANSVIEDVYIRDNFSGLQSEGNNIITITLGSIGTPALRPNDQVNVDAALGPLAFNGGHTPTQLALPGSTTIDRGSDSIVAKTNILSDQRGFFRIWDGDGDGAAHADIGAAEYLSQAMLPPVTVSGRVLGAVSGNPLRSQVVTVRDFNGNTRSALSSSFGWFVFDNLPAGFVYKVSVNARRGSISKTVFGDQDLSDADISVPGL
jgi:CSLREA domain-containing protein